MHGILVYGGPKSAPQLLSMSNKVIYEIGGQQYSMMEIGINKCQLILIPIIVEYGILKAKMELPDVWKILQLFVQHARIKDSRQVFSIQQSEPLIGFSMHRLTKSNPSPAIVMNPQNVREIMKKSCEEYVRDQVSIKRTKNEVKK
jgi:hypothetical protein